MRVVIPGGTGQVGSLLARSFHSGGHDVVVLSRRPSAAPWRVVTWDGRTVGAWASTLDGADVVINLAGRSVNCRYTQANRRAIMQSRVDSARAVGLALAQCANPPRTWLQASTATLYAHRFDAPNDDGTGIIGGDEPDAPAAWHFSIEVVTAWERAATETVPPGVRLVLLRSAMVMGADDGGIFATLLRLVRLGLGGPVDGGGQFVSWIHEQDFARAIAWLIAHDTIDGPIIIAAPNPLPYRDFMGALRRAAHVPIGLPATRWMVALGTWALRTESELVLKSRRVVPSRLLGSGFAFDFPEWSAAAADLVRRRPIDGAARVYDAPAARSSAE